MFFMSEKNYSNSFKSIDYYNEHYLTLMCEILQSSKVEDGQHLTIVNNIRGSPNIEISKFLNAYKSASSRLIKKEYPSIRKQLWKEYFWSRSYCLLTTGGAPIEVVRKYIEDQGVK